MRSIFKPLTVALLATTLIACGDSDNDDDDDNASTDPGNIVEVAEANGSFTTLVAALEVSGLDAVLADESRSFTVFAPTDAAFTAALADLGITAADLLASPNLADILLYHVIADAEIDSTAAIAAAGSTVTTANTDDVGVSLRGMDLFINASRVELPDVDANNGVIHVVDAVLLPTVDNPTSGTIDIVAATNGSFVTLIAALGASGLDTVLADPNGKFTVFAPTDAAFTAFLADEGLTAAQLLASPDLADILLYHVISGAEVNAAAATAIAGNTVEMANTDNMALSLSTADLFANLSKIDLPNVDASNGIIHVIDTVLDPPADAAAPTQTITQIAQADPNFSILVLALGAANLADTLNGPGDFTVFAPTDAAFTALLGTLGISAAQLLASPDLADILLYHVISGAEVNAAAATAIAGNTVEMANTDKMALSLSTAELFANLSKIDAPNVDASNGIIHVIDTVLMPQADAVAPTDTITQIAVGIPDFTVLVAALQTASLDGVLNDPGDYTVFAPTNAAFAAAGITLANVATVTDLDRILLKHVVSGSVDSVTAFTLNGVDVPTLNGETVALAIDSDQFTVDGAQVTSFDNRATNGIIHIINAVITLD